MNTNARNIIRGVFLISFFTLWMVGKPESWGRLLLLGLLVIPIWGRLYCGYVCPISTTIDIIGFYKPFRQSSEQYKKIFFNNKMRAGTFLTSIILLVIFIKTNFIIPFFVFLIPVGVVFTYFFGEEAWHRNCFIGTVYSWLGGLSRKGYVIQSTFCPGCGACEKTCPAGCLEVNPPEKSHIDKQHCLICGKCRRVCPQANIIYGSFKNTRGKHPGKKQHFTI